MRPPHDWLRLLFAFLLLAGCQDNKKRESDNDDEKTGDSYHRIECEPKSNVCDSLSGLRFFKKVLVVQPAPGSGTETGESWRSVVVCCTTMGPLLDTLKAYNELIKQAVKDGSTFDRSTEIDGIPVRAYVTYTGFPDGKRIEWLSFGGMEYGWILPVGETFDTYVRLLEAARKQCCLL